MTHQNGYDALLCKSGGIDPQSTSCTLVSGHSEHCCRLAGEAAHHGFKSIVYCYDTELASSVEQCETRLAYILTKAIANTGRLCTLHDLEAPPQSMTRIAAHFGGDDVLGNDPGMAWGVAMFFKQANGK